MTEMGREQTSPSTARNVRYWGGSGRHAAVQRTSAIGQERLWNSSSLMLGGLPLSKGYNWPRARKESGYIRKDLDWSDAARLVERSAGPREAFDRRDPRDRPAHRGTGAERAHSPECAR